MSEERGAGVRAILVVMLLATSAGCGGGAASSSSAGSPATTPSEAASAASPVTPEGSGAPTPAPTPPPDATLAGPSPLHVVARGVGDGDVAWLGGTLVLAGQAYVAVPNDQGDIVQSDRETPIKYYGLDGVYGRWPDSIWSYSVDFGGRAGGNRLSIAGKTDWTLARLQSNLLHFGNAPRKVDPKVRDGGLYFGLASWKAGAMLALVADDDRAPLALEAFDRSAKPVVTPKLARGSAAKCETKLLPTGSGMSFGRHPVASSLAALDSGELYVLGRDCDTGGLAVESFDRAGVGRVDALPSGEAGGAIQGGAIYAFDHGAAAATGYSKSHGAALWVLEEGKWQARELPTRKAIRSLTITAEGTVWLVDTAADYHRGRLYRQPRGGAWAEVPLPRAIAESGEEADRVAGAVWGERDADVWIVASSGATDADVVDVLRTRPATKVFDGPEGDYQTRLANRPPRPASPNCATFVLLYTLQKTTPLTYDFPLTQDALKGRSEFKDFKFAITEAGGRRFFGAFTPPPREAYDETGWRLGKKLVQLVEEKVPSSTPLLLCHQPKMLREVKIKP